MKRYLLIFILVLIPSIVAAQGVGIPARHVIDSPTASTLPYASFDFSLRFFPNGGLLAGVNVGLNDRLMVGVSYGGVNVIGQGKINWHPFAGASVHYRLLEEITALPGITIGFKSQGQGSYFEELKRFERKSLGIFGVSSKSYSFLAGLNVHLGLNYSLQTGDQDKGMNVFTGMELSLRPEFSFMSEFDFALNDNNALALGEGKGFLNVGARYVIKDAVYFEVYLIDIFENITGNFQRAVKITYLELFKI